MDTKKFFIYGVLSLVSFLLILITSCDKDNISDGGENGSRDLLDGQLTKIGEEGNYFNIFFIEPVDGFDIGNITVVSTDGEKSNLRTIATIDNPILAETASIMIDRYPEFTSYDGTNIEVNIGMKFTEDGISFMGTGETSVKSGAVNREQVLVRYDAKVGDIFSTSLHGRTQSQKVISSHEQKSVSYLILELIEHDIPNLISLNTYYNSMNGFSGGVATFEGGIEINFNVSSKNSNEPIDNGDDDGDIEYGEMTDPRDGQTYKTVEIGDQIWMAENIAYLPEITYENDWDSETEPQYAVYDYAPGSGTETVPNAKASENYEIYGVLYNWSAAIQACPTGWHLPSDAEFTELVNYLGGEDVAGGKLKATTHWESPNFGATNVSGFTALPGGSRFRSGAFNNIETNGGWWTTTDRDDLTAWYYALHYTHSKMNRFSGNRGAGFSVRCIKNN